MSYTSELEKRINRGGKENAKKVFELKKRKFLMQSLITLKVLYPYLLDVGIVATIASLLGAAPFYREKSKAYLTTLSTVDSMGNNKSINLYTTDRKEADGLVTQYSKWSKTDNDSYERRVQKYDASKLDNYTLRNLIQNPETIKKLEDIFGSPIIEEVEVSDFVSEEEFNNPEYIEATLYSIDKNEVIKIRESKKTNEMETYLVILFALVTCGMIKRVREEYGYDNKARYQDRYNIDSEYDSKISELYHSLILKREVKEEENN